MSGLLDSMRVLDVSVWRPMPHATQILADLGADVLKVEPPGGDPMRQYPAIFAGVAHGKRSIALDLKDPGQRARALALAADADVFCEGFRPGVADRLGVGYDDVRAVNPAVVYCSISGFGQTGPLRDAPGHDLTYQAAAGAIALDGGADDRAGRPGPTLPVADLASGVYAAALICAAWARRLRTGEGEHIDIAMADVVAAWVGPTGTAEVEGVARTTGGAPGYGVFQTSDDRSVSLATLSEQHLWDAVCDGLNLSDVRGLPFPDRLRRCDELNERIAAAVAALTQDDAVQRLTAAGAAVMPVLTPAEMAGHPQFRSRGLVLDGGAHPVMALPARLAHHPRRTTTEVPAVGAHPDGFARRSPG